MDILKYASLGNRKISHLKDIPKLSLFFSKVTPNSLKAWF